MPIYLTNVREEVNDITTILILLAFKLAELNEDVNASNKHLFDRSKFRKAIYRRTVARVEIILIRKEGRSLIV